MKIAVNTRLLIPNKMDGIAWFTYETLKRITRERSNDHFIFLFDRPWDEQFLFSDNITPIQIGPPSRHPFLWYLWFEHSVAPLLNKLKPDVFLSPDGYLALRSKVKSLPVIHDINFEHYPKDLPFWYRKYYRHYFPKYAKRAQRVATVSEFSKTDIIAHYGVEADKIDVVYNGISDRFKPLTSQQKKEGQNTYAEGKPYFVFVGTLHPRKNIAKMLAAFDHFKSSGKHPHQLVIVGRKKWWTYEMEKTLRDLKHKSEVHFYEQISTEQIGTVVGAAEAQLYVSTFEGFGVPILEGMQAGVPVITSNVSAMPEVAGDAALLCDPHNATHIAEEMQRLILEPQLSDTLIQKGLQRAQGFSWDRSAHLLWESISKTIDQ